MSTKLYLVERDAGVPGGKALLLVDGDGDCIPSQVAINIEQGMDALTRITVTFAVNAKDVFIGEPPIGV